MSDPVLIKNIINKMALGNRATLELGKYQLTVNDRLKRLEKEKFAERLWQKDPGLFQAQNESLPEIAMGWINIVEKMEKEIPAIRSFAKEISDSGFNHIVLLGMGGSSLAPLVFSDIFKNQKNTIRFTVLDTTDPETISKTTKEVNIATLFIVSSKSGSTAEIKALYDYFYAMMVGLKKEKAGENFVAITDENSPLSILATNKKFRKIFINASDIGGRYSALSYFGLVPAALIGVDIHEVLKRTQSMMALCSPEVPLSKNPGIVLGTALAELALAGHDKLLYTVSPELGSFGWWLEQLIAESTGKYNKGILPIDHRSSKGDLTPTDKVFLQIGMLHKMSEEKKEKNLNAPLIRICLENELEIGAEFFRWEIATATAGAILEINPFDQPNVEDSKKITSEILHQISIIGQLPPMEVSFIQDSVRYYSTQKANNGQLLMENFFTSSKPTDYIVLQAYLPENNDTNHALSLIAEELEKNLRLPVSIQFGPRYLHSTGQYHKGGPNNGFFIQFISSADDELEIPGRNYTFGTLKKAQAIGDRQALLDHNRNVMLVDTGKRIQHSLRCFQKLTEQIQSVDKRHTKYVYAYNNTEQAFEMSYGLMEDASAQRLANRP
jgi:glucose-6-phosphate isomerase